MRKVTSALFISLDGVVESPEQWQFDYFDADMMAGMEMEIAKEDTVLLGRVTYQEWASFWPNSTDEPYASHINNIPKYVVSSTLNDVGWGKYNNVTLIKRNLPDELNKLKRQPGKNIGIAGSPTLALSLIQDDLIDEFTLLVHPVLVGRGKRLFDGWRSLKRLKLVYSKETRSGVEILTYQLAKNR